MVKKELLDEFRLAVVKIFEGAVEWKDVDPEEALPIAQCVMVDARVSLMREDRESALEAEMDDPAYESLRRIQEEESQRRTGDV